MKKILLLSRDFNHLGGVVNYTKILFNNLNKDKFSVKHHVIGRPVDSIGNLRLLLLVINQYLSFNRQIKTFKPDLVHLNPSIGFRSLPRDLIYLLISKLNNCNTLLFIRGWDPGASNFFFTNRILRFIISKILSFSNHFLVLSKAFKNNLERLGIDSKKITITTTIVEFDKYYTVNKKTSNLSNLLFCSRIEKDKGIYQLVHAIFLIKSFVPEIKLYVVGKGSEMDALSAKVKQLNLNKNIEILGYKKGEQKVAYYKKSDIFVLPSFHEGLPNVFCEALASGLVFISTPVGGLADRLENGKQGFVITSMPPSPREIAIILIRLIKAPQIFEEISKNNIFEAKTTYDSKVVIEKIEKKYIEVIAEV